MSIYVDWDAQMEILKRAPKGPVAVRYRISRFGEYSEWLNWDIELVDGEGVYYQLAIEEGRSLNMVQELKGALDRARAEIEEKVIMDALLDEDEYVEKLYGWDKVDPDEINELVAARDEATLGFFKLDYASDDELKKWDGHDLDELPFSKDFWGHFVAWSPFDFGWDLEIEFD